MGTRNDSDEFMPDTVQQIRVRGYPVRKVSQRLGEFAFPSRKSQHGSVRDKGQSGNQPICATKFATPCTCRTQRQIP